MTREEAIKILRKEIECMSHAKCKDCILEAVCDPNKTPCDSEYIEIYEMAIKALEQEPKQVELEGDGYADGELVYDYGKCPSCGWDFEDGDKDWREPYCCHCGQRLKWFEEDEVE